MADDANKTLISAAFDGDLTKVKKAIEDGADIHHVGDLHYGWYRGNPSIEKSSALAASARKGHILIVKYLIETGTNPYLPLDLETAREKALFYKRNYVASYLLGVMKMPKWLNKIDEASGCTPLTFFISNKLTDKAFSIIDLGANVCKIDRNGKTPLICATEKNSLGIVDKLLAKGAIISGWSALQCALDLKHNDVVRLLINPKKLSIDVVFEDGFTPLTKSLNTRNEPIAKYLIENGADAAKIDGNNNNPLKQALELHWVELVKLLITNHLNDNKRIIIDACFDDGFTPLTKSLATLNLEIAKFLVESGANPGKIDGNGNVPLEQALELNSLDIANLLMEKGVKVPKAFKKDLLSKFAEGDYLEVFKFLIENGWNINQKDENGRTALAISASNGNLFLSTVLIENGAKMESARDEIAAFRKSNFDFDCFVRQFIVEDEAKEKRAVGCLEQTGHE